jgi:hypothetical protein
MSVPMIRAILDDKSTATATPREDAVTLVRTIAKKVRSSARISRPIANSFGGQQQYQSCRKKRTPQLRCAFPSPGSQTGGVLLDRRGAKVLPELIKSTIFNRFLQHNEKGIDRFDVTDGVSAPGRRRTCVQR